MTRTRTLGAIAAGLAGVLLAASPAAANPVVPVRPGDTYSALVARHCAPGTSWQALDFGGRNKNLIYAGESVDLRCAGGSAPAAAPVARGWVAPVNACIVSGFGMRWGRMHQGVDLAAKWGTPVRAAAAGTVSVGYQASGAGYYTMINHGNGLWTHYFHQSSFAVRSGWVAAGQVIGYVGSTGNSTGAHLHFEVRPYGNWGAAVNPVVAMAARGVTLRWC